MDNKQDVYVPSVSRFRFTRIVPKCKELIKFLLSYRRELYFIHDFFYLDARAMERFRGCVPIFILVAVYSGWRYIKNQNNCENAM